MIHIAKNEEDVKKIVTKELRKLNKAGLLVEVAPYNTDRKYPCFVIPFTIDNRLLGSESVDLLVYFKKVSKSIATKFLETIDEFDIVPGFNSEAIDLKSGNQYDSRDLNA